MCRHGDGVVGLGHVKSNAQPHFDGEEVGEGKERAVLVQIRLCIP